MFPERCKLVCTHGTLVTKLRPALSAFEEQDPLAFRACRVLLVPGAVVGVAEAVNTQLTKKKKEATDICNL